MCRKNSKIWRDNLCTLKLLKEVTFNKLSGYVYAFISGRSWFERFEAEWNDLVDFQMKGVIFRVKNDPITMRMWTNERDNYTRIQKEDKKFPSKEYIFVVETKQLEAIVGNEIKLQVLVS